MQSLPAARLFSSGRLFTPPHEPKQTPFPMTVSKITDLHLMCSVVELVFYFAKTLIQLKL